MKSRTKLGILTLMVVVILIVIARLIKINLTPNLSLISPQLEFSKTFILEFKSSNLYKIINSNLAGQKGHFAVYVESLPSGEKYTLNELDSFPAASLYKLILLAAVLREVEEGRLNLEENLSGTKSHLSEVLGEVDFGYEEAPHDIEYSVKEALERVGRISDNFAAILLTEKLRAIRQKEEGNKGPSNRLLIKMTKELGMESTDFEADPVQTTASDIAIFFKKLYQGQIVSPLTSEKITSLLSLSKISDRIPIKLPEEVKIIHKTGELPRVRHDAGIVYLLDNKGAYLLILLSKDLEFEDDGIEVLGKISKDVYDYFNDRDR